MPPKGGGLVGTGPLCHARSRSPRSPRDVRQSQGYTAPPLAITAAEADAGVRSSAGGEEVGTQRTHLLPGCLVAAHHLAAASLSIFLFGR